MKYKRTYTNGELAGYQCEKANIKIHYYDVTPLGNWHKDYIVPELEKIGKAFRFESLKEAKKHIEIYL